MYSTHSRFTTKADLWFSQQAQALITYAETDNKFASSLAYHIQQRNWKPLTSSSITSTYLSVPTDQDTAVRNTHWLLGALDTGSQHTQTRGLLANWAQNYESPQDFIIGIVGVAIIGPTLGILNKKKKHQSHLQIVFAEDFYAKQSKTKVASQAQELSLDIVKTELKLVGVNAFNLHPDTAEWLLLEPATKIYTDTEATLKKLLATAKGEKLSHSVLLSETGSIVAIAISPSVSDSLVGETGAKLSS